MVIPAKAGIQREIHFIRRLTQITQIDLNIAAFGDREPRSEKS
jgi:hypothetical protein